MEKRTRNNRRRARKFLRDLPAHPEADFAHAEKRLALLLAHAERRGELRERDRGCPRCEHLNRLSQEIARLKGTWERREYDEETIESDLLC